MIMNIGISIKIELFILTDANTANIADTKNYTDDHTNVSSKLIFNI